VLVSGFYLSRTDDLLNPMYVYRIPMACHGVANGPNRLLLRGIRPSCMSQGVPTCTTVYALNGLQNGLHGSGVYRARAPSLRDPQEVTSRARRPRRGSRYLTNPGSWRPSWSCRRASAARSPRPGPKQGRPNRPREARGIGDTWAIHQTTPANMLFQSADRFRRDLAVFTYASVQRNGVMPPPGYHRA
jgi:hypothetical protein